jgi:large subunit ribosomal protein L23
MMDLYSVIKSPIITEKATMANEKCNQIVLEVDPRANKIEIKRAVEQLLKKKVLAVQTLNRKGKKKRTGRLIGRRPNTKRAIVRLYPGEKFDLFEGA